MKLPKPRKYQRDGVRQINRFDGRALVADPMGLGKTPQFLWYQDWFLKYKKGLTVVVCPANVKYQWQDEVNNFLRKSAVVVEGRSIDAKVLDQIDSGKKIVVLNYDILYGRKGQLLDWAKLLNRMKPKVVCVDEVQYIRNRKTKRSRAVRRLCKGVRRIVGLGGTGGVEKSPAEIWNFLNIIRPDKFPQFFPFALEYTNARKTRFGWEYPGGKNLKKLNRILSKTCMIRRQISEVLKDLPKKVRSVVPVEITNKTKYRKEVKALGGWLAAGGWDEMERKAKFTKLRRMIGEFKLPLVREWVQNFLEQEKGKLIVFGIHKKFLGQLHKWFLNQSVLVTGAVTGRKRRDRFRTFDRDPSCRILFGNLHAVGVGYNGQVANHILMAEMDWNPTSHAQGEARAHRMGQKRIVFVTYLICKGTIEELLAKSAQKKQGILSEMLDGRKSVKEMNVFDLLTRKLVRL